MWVELVSQSACPWCMLVCVQGALGVVTKYLDLQAFLQGMM